MDPSLPNQLSELTRCSDKVTLSSHLELASPCNAGERMLESVSPSEVPFARTTAPIRVRFGLASDDPSVLTTTQESEHQRSESEKGDKRENQLEKLVLGHITNLFL